MRIAVSSFLSPRVLDPSAAVEDVERAPESAPGVAVELSGRALHRAAKMDAFTQPGSEDELSSQQKQELARLRQREQQVRRNQAATTAASGGLARPGPTHYEQGPDGRRYAIDAEVQLTVGAGMSAEETLRIADQLRAVSSGPPGSGAAQVHARAASLAADARRRIDQAQTNEAPVVHLEIPDTEDQGLSQTGRRALKAYSAA